MGKPAEMTGMLAKTEVSACVHVCIPGMCSMCERLCLYMSECIAATVMGQAFPGKTFLCASQTMCM